MLDINERELSLIENTFLFKGAGEASVAYALSSPLCLKQAYEKDSVVYSTTSFERSLGIVLRGALLVSKPTEGGKRLIVGKLIEGDLFGAAAIYTELPSYASDIEAEAASEILFLPQRLISELMNMDFCIAENYIRYLSGRIQFLSSKVTSLAAGSAELRLAHYLLENAQDGIVRVGSMSELSNMLSIGRASLYRALDALTACGAVRKDGKNIVITDKTRLISEEH